MAEALTLRIGSPADLYAYVSQQLAFFGGVESDGPLLEQSKRQALAHFEAMAARVHAFRTGWFDHLHSLQYASFLYLAGRAVWRADPKSALVDRLFCLNKMLSTIELHPAVDLPGAFLLSHAIGTVLGAATYGEGLVVFQNVTVGRVGENRPQIGRDVVLFAGSTVTGRSVIGDCSVVAAGTNVHNVEVPPDSMVRQAGDRLAIETRRRDYHALYMSPES